MQELEKINKRRLALKRLKNNIYEKQKAKLLKKCSTNIYEPKIHKGVKGTLSEIKNFYFNQFISEIFDNSFIYKWNESLLLNDFPELEGFIFIECLVCSK